VLKKIAPADIDALAEGELRRSRAAQVAAAFWKDGQGYTLVCFRSVAGYMMGLLSHSAQPGSELF
jgi:sarcosine oxidase subunit gamma